MKRIVMILVCLIWGFFALPVSAETYGETEENSILAEDDALDYSQVQQALDEILPETFKMSFSDLVTAFASGSVNEIFSGLKDYILDQLFYEVTYNWKTMGQMIGIVLISSVFTSFSMAFFVPLAFSSSIIFPTPSSLITGLSCMNDANCPAILPTLPALISDSRL